MNDSDVLLRTVHGSRLYGLDTPESDYDVYVVTLHGRAHQHIDGKGNDITTIPLADFERFVSKGVPQALEALWSPFKWVDYRWWPYLSALRPNLYQAEDTYRRTIANFRAVGDFKRTRHALRLTLSVKDLRESGRFSPRLTPNQVETITRWATVLTPTTTSR